MNEFHSFSLSLIQEYHAVSRARNPSQRKIVANGDLVPGAPHGHGQHEPGVNTDLETKDWLRDKSLKFGDGPRHYQVPASFLNTYLLMRSVQVLLLVGLWSAALIFGLDNIDTHYDHVLNNTEPHMCVVWQGASILSPDRLQSLAMLVLVPGLLGPCLVMMLELGVSLVQSWASNDGATVMDTSDRPGQRRVLAGVMIMVTLTYTTGMLLAEALISQEDNYMLGLLFKYVLGSADLLTTPLIICTMDSEIRQGVCFLFR